jgi:hypothetical protein
MNLVEMFVLVFLSALFGLLGLYLSEHFGLLGWLGALPGVAGVTLILFVLSNGYRELFWMTTHSFRQRPICRMGKCTSRRYYVLEADREEAMFRCRCGDRYVSHGDSFLQVQQDGTRHPYMVQSSSGSWERA